MKTQTEARKKSTIKAQVSGEEKMWCEEGLGKRGFREEEDGSLAREERQLDVTSMNTTWHVYPFLMTREQSRNKANTEKIRTLLLLATIWCEHT